MLRELIHEFEVIDSEEKLKKFEIKTLLSGNLFNLSKANNKEIKVFPIPVGKTTKVLLFLQVSKILN